MFATFVINRIIKWSLDKSCCDIFMWHLFNLETKLIKVCWSFDIVRVMFPTDLYGFDSRYYNTKSLWRFLSMQVFEDLLDESFYSNRNYYSIYRRNGNHQFTIEKEYHNSVLQHSTRMKTVMEIKIKRKV